MLNHSNYDIFINILLLKINITDNGYCQIIFPGVAKYTCHFLVNLI